MPPMTAKLAPEHGLTDRTVIFAREYAKRLVIDDAERAAGISKGYGSELLARADVQDYIRWLVFGKKTSSIGPAKILRRTWELANSDITDVFYHDPADLRTLPAGVRRAIKKIKFTTVETEDGNGGVKRTTTGQIEMHPKMPALQLLAIATGAVRAADSGGGADGFEGFTILPPSDGKMIEGEAE